MSSREITSIEAWDMIRRKHDAEALQDYEHWLQTGDLDMPEDNERQPVYRIMAGSRNIVFDSASRSFLEGDIVLVELTKRQCDFLVPLLNHPGMPFPYQAHYRLYDPDDKRTLSNEEVCEVLRPMASYIRRRTKDLEIRFSINTVRGAGYMFLPDESVQNNYIVLENTISGT